MLTVTLLNNGNFELKSEKIQAFIDTPGSYNKIKLAANINCCPTVYSDEKAVPVVSPITFSVTSNSIQINPLFFGLTFPNDTYKDGVYHFEVKLFKTNDTFVFEETCIFADITFKCLVASYLQGLLEKGQDGMCSTSIHILHYALVNGSNCGCNCADMCNVFKELYTLLNPLIPKNTGCGC